MVGRDALPPVEAIGREPVMSDQRESVLTAMYEGFNARDIDAVLAQMDETVDWPRAFEGDRVTGLDAVRGYWTQQWTEIDPTVTPVGVTWRSPDVAAVEVDQVVRDMDGNLLGEGRVLHVYSFTGDLVSRMDVEPA